MEQDSAFLSFIHFSLFIITHIIFKLYIITYTEIVK